MLVSTSLSRLTTRWRELRAWLSGSDQERHFHSWLDWPIDDRVDTLRGVVRGWCYARSGRTIVAVRARVGVRVYRGTWGLERRDVSAAGYPGALHSGFEIPVTLTPKQATCWLQVKLDDGQWYRFRSFRLSTPK